MKQEVMTIISQKMLAPRIYELVLAGDLVKEMEQPGQFLHIRVPRKDLLLRRPISIHKIDHTTENCSIIYRIEGEGTKAFSELEAGDKLDVMGPLGNGFDLSDLNAGDTAYLVGGGIGVPPLYELGRQLKAKGMNVVSFLGFGSQELMYKTAEFSEISDLRIATDDGTYGVQGNVGNLLMADSGKPDAVFACGNNGLLKTTEQLFSDLKNVQLSLEARMACGMGACYACVCHVADDETGQKSVKVCDDGPVFKAGEVIY